MLGVAVGGIGAGQQVGLLGAGRHTGGGAAALHVDQHCRHFREIGQTDKLRHQADTGAGCRGKGARAVPAGTDHDADGRELVLRLHDGVFAVAGFLVAPIALTEGLERLRQ